MSLIFKEETHEYFLDGVRLRSVTQVINDELGNPFEHVDRDVLDRASAFGRSVHTAIQYHIRGILDSESIDDAIKAYFHAAVMFLQDYIGEVLFVETPMHADGMFAGTPDLVARCKRDGRVVIVDWKTATQIDNGYCALQIGGYEHLVRRKLDYKKLIRRYVVQLLPDGTYRIYEYSDTNDKQRFLALIQKGDNAMSKDNKINEMLQLPELPSENMMLVQANSILKQAMVMPVTDMVEYEDASSFLKMVKKSAKAAEKERKLYADPVNEAKNRIQEFFNPIKNTIKKAEDTIKEKLLAYDNEQKRIAKEQSLKAQAEKSTILSILDRDIKEAEAAGDLEKAEMYENRKRELEQKAVVAPVNEHKQNVSGVHTMTRFVPVIEDMAQAIKACYEDETLRHLLTLDQVLLNKFATAHKNTYPIKGIVFEKRESICTRTA